MREMKFRAWDKKKKVMVPHEKLFRLDCSNEYPFLALLKNMYSDAIVPFDVEIMRYAGRKDRNGKDICEDDIVLITGEQELDFGLAFQWNEKAVVKWSEDECGFYLDVINKREVSICQDGYFTLDTFPLRKWGEEEWPIEYEVVGNVWESARLGEVRE